MSGQLVADEPCAAVVPDHKLRFLGLQALVAVCVSAERDLDAAGRTRVCRERQREAAAEAWPVRDRHVDRAFGVDVAALGRCR